MMREIEMRMKNLDEKRQTIAKQHYERLAGDLSKYRVPGHMHSGYLMYLMLGYEAGGFLMAVLEDSLSGALGRADAINKRALPEHGMFMYNCMPIGSHGDPKSVREWIKKGGIIGMMEASQKEESEVENV